MDRDVSFLPSFHHLSDELELNHTDRQFVRQECYESADVTAKNQERKDRETKEGDNREDIVFFAQDGREMASEKKEERGTLIC